MLKVVGRMLAILVAISMLVACGSGGGSGIGGSGGGGVGAKGPISGATVTVENLSGVNFLGRTFATNSQGAFDLPTIPASDFPIVVTLTGGQLPNGDTFTGTLKGIFEYGADQSNIHLTTMSTLLYEIWALDPNAGADAAKAKAKGLLQVMGIPADDNTFTANPVNSAIETMQQQMIYLLGVDDRSGSLGDIQSVISTLAPVANDPNITEISAVLPVELGGAASFAEFFNSDVVKQEIAARVVKGLEGSSGAVTLAAAMEAVKAKIDAAVANGDKAGAIILGSDTVVLEKNTSSDPITVNGLQVDGDGATGTFSLVVTAGSPSGISVSDSTRVNGESFTVTAGNTAGSGSITITYTEPAGGEVKRILPVKVLADTEGAVKNMRLGVPSLIRFVSSDKTKILKNANKVPWSGELVAEYDVVNADTAHVVSFVLPSGLVFNGTKADGSIVTSRNYDIVVGATRGANLSESFDNDPNRGDVKVKVGANDINPQVGTMTVNIWDNINHNTRLGSATNSTVLYSDGTARTPRAMYNATYSTTDIASAAKQLFKYNATDDSDALYDDDKEKIAFGGRFYGFVQTWEQFAGESSDRCAAMMAAINTADALAIKYVWPNKDVVSASGFGLGNSAITGGTLSASVASMTWNDREKACFTTVTVDDGEGSLFPMAVTAARTTYGNIDSIGVEYNDGTVKMNFKNSIRFMQNGTLQ